MSKLSHILDFKLVDLESYSLTVSQVLFLGFILVATKLILWGIKKAINRSKRLDITHDGNKQAIFQIISYVIYVIAISIGLESVGVKLNALMTGSAALLVGVGMGLQQTFRDFISGVILLVEGTLRVDDILEVDGQVVKVLEIGIRTSKVINRNDIIIIMPNSIIVGGNVVNWSHQIKDTRFSVEVGVAYGSDLNKVKRILIDACKAHPEVLDKEEPAARLINFGESSLDFKVFFHSKEAFRIEPVKADIREKIYSDFIAEGVVIPFPQRDLHVIGNVGLSKE